MTSLPNNPTYWSLSQLSSALRSRRISPVEVTQACITRISQEDTKVNAVITLMEEEALKQARQAEADIQSGHYRGPLHGVPIGIKDLINARGARTTFGSMRYLNHMPETDATVITLLRQAGAIILAKLNLHQFGAGGTGDRSFFGPTRNPHNLAKVAGGSSSGSGAAVVAHFCFGALGSDTGGSIRIPASFCGVVGMKPTFGTVSTHGAMTLSSTLDHLGPMTRTVEDNAMMLNGLAGYDPKDPCSMNIERQDYTLGLRAGIRGMTFGVPSNFYLELVDSQVREVYGRTLQTLVDQGARLMRISLPLMDELLWAQQTILITEAFSALRREIEGAPDSMDDEVRERLMLGRKTPAHQYIRALQTRNAAIQMFREVFRQIDVMITPTVAVLPPDIAERQLTVDGKIQDLSILSRLTGPSNTTGLPAISVPAGRVMDGMPIGVQLIGPTFSEPVLYRAAYAIEQAH